MRDFLKNLTKKSKLEAALNTLSLEMWVLDTSHEMAKVWTTSCASPFPRWPLTETENIYAFQAHIANTRSKNWQLNVWRTTQYFDSTTSLYSPFYYVFIFNEKLGRKPWKSKKRKWHSSRRPLMASSVSSHSFVDSRAASACLPFRLLCICLRVLGSAWVTSSQTQLPPRPEGAEGARVGKRTDQASPHPAMSSSVISYIKA